MTTMYCEPPMDPGRMLLAYTALVLLFCLTVAWLGGF